MKLYCDKTRLKMGDRCYWIHLFGSKVYLSPILDMYNGEIVSYEMSERPVLTPVLSCWIKHLRTGHIEKAASYIQIKAGSTSIALIKKH